MSKPWTIAIDGPAGAGKSTVARLLARRLGYLYVDTGAMYRVVALHALRQRSQDLSDDEISALARAVRIEFVAVPGEEAQRILLNGEDVTEAIRTPEVAERSSVVSAIPGVRSALVALQQAMGASGGVVMEGRDIGTVVMPTAQVKVFLTASPEERAARRHADLLARGNSVNLEDVRAEQDARDHRDATRTVAPLVPAPDAVLLKSDDLPPELVVDEIMEIIDDRRRDA
ncbi:MAG: (d)CMP kinase [Capsulimonadales bacterium]|nr:(d)CMP kinase [Capsulimonadales bacterium]